MCPEITILEVARKCYFGPPHFHDQPYKLEAAAFEIVLGSKPLLLVLHQAS